MKIVDSLSKHKFRIYSLKERPDLAEVCAAWSHAEWNCQVAGRTLEDTLQRYRERTKNVTRFPLTWVAVSSLDKPMGMAGLKETEHPDRLDLGPWLASIYVHPLYRRQGIAMNLIEHTAQFARKELGVKRLFLYSAGDESDMLYKKLGWFPIGKVRDPTGLNPEGKTLMQRDLEDV